MAFWATPNGYYTIAVILAALLIVSHNMLHRAVLTLKALIESKLPAPVATVADNALDFVDKLAAQSVQHSASEILDVIERLTKIGVVNANVQTVTQAKQADIFTDAVAASVKSDVVAGVLNKLGPLKTQAEALYGDLSGMIGEYIETHVQSLKS